MTIQEMKQRLFDDKVVTHSVSHGKPSIMFTGTLKKQGKTLGQYFNEHPEVFESVLDFEPREALYRITHDITETPKCPVCGKDCRFAGSSEGYSTICGDKSCARERQAQTVMAKYGVANPLQSKAIREKAKATLKANFQNEEYRAQWNQKHKETNLAKYGVEHLSKSKEYQESKRQKCREKYGVDYISQTDSWKQAVKDSVQAKYGVDNVSELQEVKDKRKQTCQELYGTKYYMASDEFREKSKQTCLEKFGVENFAQSQNFNQKFKETCMTRFGVPHNMMSEECREKARQTSLEKFGVPYYTQTQEFLDRFRNTCQEKYGVDYPMQLDSCREKSVQTSLEKFGTTHYSKTQEFKDSVEQTCMERYGVEHVMQVPEFAHKALSHSGPTQPERKLIECLTQRGLEFQYQYHCNGKNFDFAIFQNGELAVLVEVDGEYFHGLTSDTDGCQVHGETDCERFQRVPEGVKLVVCDSLRIEECISEILACLNVSYEGWIQEIVDSLPKEFPYPEYPEERIRRDYRHLCEWEEFQPKSRVCDSAIRQFHKSIWSARVGNNPSPVEAWSNPKLLERCVRNRFIYSSSLSSQAIANGFNVCKIAPKVSVFSAGLAKRLVRTYLQSFSEVFDPFSGFSGRMLGTCACGKKYIGQDLSGTAVSESGKLRDFLNLNAELSQRDVMESSGTYECLFTCSPYGLKETWNNEGQQDLKCDDWIDVCLKNFQCRRYLFVVDDPGRYRDYVVEELENASHLGSNSEYVVCIDREV